MMIVVLGVTTILSTLSSEGLRRTSAQEGIVESYLAAEGALHRMIADMSGYGSLWDQQAPLANSPAGYTEYSPNSYAANNGVPLCESGPGCHRNYFPAGGGFIKNFGPYGSDGSVVDESYAITEQLDPESPPAADASIGEHPAWVQVERLDETLPSAAAVGGNLSSSLAEGGNAKEVRFRITGTALREVRGRIGTATVVSVVKMPVM
jgi:hypothetical protein